MAWSRTSGVAPLAVFFDATGTTSTATTRPFHDVEYRWNFGDPAGGATWSRGSRAGSSSKNLAMGPLAAHVYETPGTYTITLTVADGTNSASTNCAQVTVEDPDVVFAGAETLCVSRSPGGSFSGCPALAAQTTSTSFSSIINTIAGNGALYKRILFECDGTYTASTSGSLTFSGPGIVGAYPAGCPSRAKPIINGAPSDKIRLGSGTNATFGDWRIMDLEFSGSLGVGTAIAHAGTSRRVTILRCDIDGANSGIQADLNILDAHNNPTRVQELYRELALVENDVTNSTGGFGVFGAASQFMMLGNRITNTTGGHGMRTQYTRNSVVSNNEFGPASATSLTMRAIFHFISDRTGSAGRYTIDNAAYTELGVFSDNRIIGGTGTIPFTLKSINSFEDARLRNHIIERNWMTLGTNGLTPVFQTEAGLLSIRNNLVDTTPSGGAGISFGLTKSTGTPSQADSIFVYNNSNFSNKGDSPFIILDVLAAPTNLVVRNNLGYAPGNSDSNTTAIRNWLGVAITQSNNSTTAQIQGISPNFQATPPLQPSDWRPTAGYAVDGGFSVPVFSDFFTAARTGTYDMGAVNP